MTALLPETAEVGPQPMMAAPMPPSLKSFSVADEAAREGFFLRLRFLARLEGAWWW